MHYTPNASHVVFFPRRWLMKKLKRHQAKKYTATRPQWELDYDLQAQDDLSLFWQYLEIGMFLTVCAFCVLINVAMKLVVLKVQVSSPHDCKFLYYILRQID